MNARAVARIFVALVALASVANAAWMLANAWGWFVTVPGVADTGSANAHFIRDVGAVYLIAGAALLWTLARPAQGYPVFVVCTLFYALHALGHAAEIALGLLPPSHWLIDLPLVFVPALGLGLLALPGRWRAWLAPV